jgi:hypothetical protein
VFDRLKMPREMVGVCQDIVTDLQANPPLGRIGKVRMTADMDVSLCI